MNKQVKLAIAAAAALLAVSTASHAQKADPSKGKWLRRRRRTKCSEERLRPLLAHWFLHSRHGDRWLR